MQTNVLGRRIAALRGDRGWSQEVLAARVAISRVALSHIEAGMSNPSERTVVLIAGLLRIEPRDLVAGTTYPVAKADRLPATAPRYTENELQLDLLDLDIGRDDFDGGPWLALLEELESATFDPSERALLAAARRRVRERGADPR